MRITKFIHSTWKVYKFWASSGPCFLVFRLNTDIYVINLRIQFEYGKIRTGQTPNLETFLAVIIQLFLLLYLIRMLHPITLFAMPRKQNKTKHKKNKAESLWLDFYKGVFRTLSNNYDRGPRYVPDLVWYCAGSLSTT